MADNARVLRGIRRKRGIAYTALTPNLKGFQDAVSDDHHLHIFFLTELSSLLDDLDLWIGLSESKFCVNVNNRSIDFKLHFR